MSSRSLFATLLGLTAMVATAVESAPLRPAPPSSVPPPVQGTTAANADTPGVARVNVPSDIRGLLDEVSRTYQGMTSYRFEGMINVAVNVQGTQQTMDIPIMAAVVKPGKSRTEMRNPMMGVVNISDGQQTWTYVPQLGQYTRKMVTPLKTEAGGEAAAAAPTAPSPLDRYLSLTTRLKGARNSGHDTLDFQGSRVPCIMIEADYEPPAELNIELSPTTFWIDKSRHLVLKEVTKMKTRAPSGGPMEMTQTTTFQVADVGHPLPDSLFTFKAPAGAKEVPELAMPGTQGRLVVAPHSQSPDFSGKTAANFTLSDLKGRPMSLASLHGKVVLLDFWATWCGPCRMELPTVAKLHQEFKKKGLMVVGVNVGEKADVVVRFLKQRGYDFTVLLDTKGEIAGKYGASGIPTVVVIDKAGMISSHFVGVRSEEDLREALKKVGME